VPAIYLTEINDSMCLCVLSSLTVARHCVSFVGCHIVMLIQMWGLDATFFTSFQTLKLIAQSLNC